MIVADAAHHDINAPNYPLGSPDGLACIYVLYVYGSQSCTYTRIRTDRFDFSNADERETLITI